MKKYYILTNLFVAASFFSIAQVSPALQWQKNLGGSSGETANSIIQTSDSGYIAAGYSYSNDGDVNGIHGREVFYQSIKHKK